MLGYLQRKQVNDIESLSTSLQVTSYRPEYYNEGKKDQCFVTAYEREEVVEEELSLCGYFCMQAEELMDAIAKSKYSIGDVIKMVKGRKQNSEEG